MHWTCCRWHYHWISLTLCMLTLPSLSINEHLISIWKDLTQKWLIYVTFLVDFLIPQIDDVSIIQFLDKILHQNWSWLIIICCTHPQYHPPQTQTHLHTRTTLFPSFPSMAKIQDKKKRKRKLCPPEIDISHLNYFQWAHCLFDSVEMALSSKQMKEENHLFGRMEL